MSFTYICSFVSHNYPFHERRNELERDGNKLSKAREQSSLGLQTSRVPRWRHWIMQMSYVSCPPCVVSGVWDLTGHGWFMNLFLGEHFSRLIHPKCSAVPVEMHELVVSRTFQVLWPRAITHSHYLDSWWKLHHLRNKVFCMLSSPESRVLPREGRIQQKALLNPKRFPYFRVSTVAFCID